jgi:uncharacterized membrane protein
MLLAQRKEAIEDLEKKLRSAKTDLIAQNLTRHRAVLAFLRIQNAKKLYVFSWEEGTCHVHSNLRQKKKKKNQSTAVDCRPVQSGAAADRTGLHR